MQDVVQSRMEHAKHFLLVSNYSIKEIADLCGYHNETFFMKQFKKNIHVTPSQYRAQARKNYRNSKIVIFLPHFPVTFNTVVTLLTTTPTLLYEEEHLVF